MAVPPPEGAVQVAVLEPGVEVKIVVAEGVLFLVETFQFLYRRIALPLHVQQRYLVFLLAIAVLMYSLSVVKGSLADRLYRRENSSLLQYVLWGCSKR